MISEEAIDALLRDDPQNIEALVSKAELRESAGDDRAANAFYQAALKAAGMAQPLPAAMRDPIARAQAGVARGLAYFERSLEQALERAGLPEGRRPPRFQESLELMLGRKPATLGIQKPSSYYFPGLEQRRYYERSELPWAADIEAAAPAIRKELRDRLATGADEFAPYLVSDPSRPRSEFHGLLDNPEWSTLYLWQNGGAVKANAEHFPRTLEAVSRLDLAHISVRSPSILFSRLSAGARIPAHHGVMNARMICHLPLIVPPGCCFRVGGETREWRECELLAFDDTVEHEAWNDSGEDRIILIFDVWKPEIEPDERRAIAALFEAVDAYSRPTS